MARALDKTQKNPSPPLKKIMIFRNALVTLGVGSKFKKILWEHQSLLKNPLGGEVVQSEQACFLKAYKDSDRLRDARIVLGVFFPTLDGIYFESVSLAYH